MCLGSRLIDMSIIQVSVPLSDTIGVKGGSWRNSEVDAVALSYFAPGLNFLVMSHSGCACGRNCKEHHQLRTRDGPGISRHSHRSSIRGTPASHSVTDRYQCQNSNHYSKACIVPSRLSPPTMSSGTDYYLTLCLDEAAKFPLHYRHSCVLVRGGKVIGQGYNDYHRGFDGDSVKIGRLGSAGGQMLYSLANRGRDPRPKWKMDN